MRTGVRGLTREKDVQQTVVDAARLLGWRCYHTFDSRRSTPGFPDLCLVKMNRLMFIEIKNENGKLTEEQLGWLEALRLVPGVDVLICRPANLDDILALLAA